ncbi:MAG: hypothetical protein H7A49_16460 [Akkermansiaceae bacterium]|nr:hypothetical protein [Akkermansiaceae bacterium]
MRRLSGFLAAVICAVCSPHLRAEGVVLRDERGVFHMSNGRLEVSIRKEDGDVTRMKLNGRDLLAGGTGYWSIVANSGSSRVNGFGKSEETRVTIDPAANDGERAEVAMRFRGTGKDGGFPGAFEVRYSLAEDSQALFAAAVLSHGPGDRFCTVAEARFAMKLAPDIFNHLSIDRDRDRDMPAPEDWEKGTGLMLKEARRLTTGRFAGEVEHKYAYSAILPDLPAFGWSGTEQKYGVWFINPSSEYISGGCTKMELTGHLDVGGGARPTLLNMWHGSHYGGVVLRLQDDEAWSKVIGPFAIFCNDGAPPDQLWNGAIRYAVSQRHAWPFDWFDHPAYPKSSQRGALAGRIRISSDQPDDKPLGSIRVGLTAPDHVLGGNGWRSETIDWQRDGRNPQYWSKASKNGAFRISKVPAGDYVLRAFVDGIPGEFARGDIRVEAGKTVELGEVSWEPERAGPTIWQIGTADRSAAEFRNGDRYWKWGNHLAYRTLFPQGVDLTIGKGNPAKDWYICQPLDLDADGKVLGPSTWKVRFDCPEISEDGAVLRIGFCGTRARSSLDFGLNGKQFASTGPLPEAGVMHRDSHRGRWFERRFDVPADLLRASGNVLTLTLHGREWHQGVLYDFLRLEDAGKPTEAAADP